MLVCFVLTVIPSLLLISGSSARYLQNDNAVAQCRTNRTYTVVAGDNCEIIARRHSAPRASLVSINDIRPDCADLKVGQILCLPEPCALYPVNRGATCIGMVEEAGITISELFAWNPFINSECTNLVAGDQVCIAQPGKRPTPSPTNPGITTVIKGSEYATATVIPPGPVPHGTTRKCGQYYQVKRGDYCELVADNFNIELDLFQAINPDINADCTNLVPGLYYCVLPTWDWNQTTTSTVTATYTSAPAPTPSGTTPHCYEWYVVRSGDTCIRISSLYGITPDDLRLWNPSLREDCSNLKPAHAYCVHGEREAAASAKWIDAEATADAGMPADMSMVEMIE